jgi:hypothetical protein
MPCRRMTTRKYKLRPSPPYPAQECKGLVKKGSDGATYVSKANARGIYRWTRKAKEAGGKGRKFVTHDNYAKPFAVYDDGKRIVVYRQTHDKEANAYVQGKQVYEASYKHIWVGKNPVGNSVLVQTGENNYVYVGAKIMSFSLKPGDSIVTYLSPLGNNDYPYPYIVGKHNVYLLVEDKIVPKDALDMSQDPYGQYYGHVKTERGDEAKKRAVNLKTKVIEKRIL